MGFRGIERVTGINHNTIINWVRQAGITLPDAPDSDEIPESTELDELQTFVGSKKNKIWLWTAVSHGIPGILAWVLGDRSAETFKKLWKIVRGWRSFFYVTDGYVVYQIFINDLDHIVDKTYMTRVEGENTRLRHPPRSLTSKDFMLFKVYRDVEDIRSLVASLPKVFDYSPTC